MLALLKPRALQWSSDDSGMLTRTIRYKKGVQMSASRIRHPLSIYDAI